jgi:hypothetical protein
VIETDAVTALIPSLDLFRQSPPGNWNSVIFVVMHALQCFMFKG